MLLGKMALRTLRTVLLVAVILVVAQVIVLYRTSMYVGALSGLLAYVYTDTNSSTSTLVNATSVRQVLSEFADLGLPLCEVDPPGLVGPLAVDLQPKSWEELQKLHRHVQHGGWYRPRDCRSREHVAVVVPYRDRDLHLRVLLHILHPLLQRQQLHYRILLSEPEMPTVFNRGLAMNVGVREALRLGNFTCLVLHDVDLFPENDRNLYTCPHSPIHLSVAIDKHRYRPPYFTYFGGVSAMSREHYQKINGFSNVFFGWGGEDDDLYTRVKHVGLNVSRPPVEIGRYKMYKHSRDKTNKSNGLAGRLLSTSSSRMSWDGLGNLNASTLKVEEHPLYTHVLFRVDKDAVMEELGQREGKNYTESKG